MGGDAVRMRPVAAYPTMGGRLENRHWTTPETKPSLRNRTFSRSIAFETVQVSSERSLSRSVAVKALCIERLFVFNNIRRNASPPHTGNLVFRDKKAGSLVRFEEASVRIG